MWCLASIISLLAALAPLPQARALAAGSDGITTAVEPSLLSFEVGGNELKPRQPDLPDVLHPYHAKSIELTESALSDPSLRCTRGVSYGPLDHQLVDVWTTASSPSPNDSKKKPIVVFLHGGAWDWGYREYVGFCAKNICGDDGDGQAIMLAPTYRIGKGHEQMWPRSRDDIVELLQWVASSSNKNDDGLLDHADPTKIILAGHSAGGHLAACIGLDPLHLRSHGVDPNIIKGLFLVSCPLGICAQDFFVPWSKRRWTWFVLGPVARLIYRRAFLKVLRPVVGSRESSSLESINQIAEDASPLFRVASSTYVEEEDFLSQMPPLVHFSFATKKDFPICRPQAESLKGALHGRAQVEILEMPVDGHFESHFALNDASCEWNLALRKHLSSL